MLNAFIDSKAKRRLLGALFKFPERSFYPSELRELTGISARALPLMLSEMAKAGVLRMFIKRRRKYFQVNPHLDWYDELKELVSDEAVAGVDPASKLVKRLARAKAAILTGVFTGQPQVEVDLVLVGKGLKGARIDKLLSELEKFAGQEVNYCEMDEEEYQHRRHMSDRFIRNVLDNPHIAVFDKLTPRQRRKNKKN